MIEYLDAAHEAYRRLKWQEANRPPPEELEKIRKVETVEARRQKMARFRRSLA